LIPEDQQLRMSQNVEAFNLISTNVSEEIYEDLLYRDQYHFNALKAWTYLEKEYGLMDILDHTKLYRELINLRMQNNDDLKKHLTVLEKLLREFSRIPSEYSVTMKETDKKMHLYHSLSNHYANFVRDKMKTHTYDELRKFLLETYELEQSRRDYYNRERNNTGSGVNNVQRNSIPRGGYQGRQSRQKNQQENSEENSEKNQNQSNGTNNVYRGSNFNTNGRGRGSGRSPQTGSTPVECDYCGKKRHTAEDCWKRQEDEAATGSEKAKEKNKKSQVHNVGEVQETQAANRTAQL
jgi:hypothetical protein